MTGARADYGLLYWLLKEAKFDTDITLQIIASAMHLSPEFGLSFKKIEEDGFIIDDKIEMLLSSDSAVGITKSIGLGVISFADVLARLQPNIIVLLGDRFETLAAAQAAFISKIPIAHIHGGELTFGIYDDGIRHCITKMSHLHFVAKKEYRDRVIQLGENPDTVFHVGAMVLDSLQNYALLKKNELEILLDIKFRKYSFLITYHPETLGAFSSREQFFKLLDALAMFEDATLIFTKSNADTDGRIINTMIDEYCVKNEGRAKGFVEVGHKNYLSLLSVVDICIGNSSSGIIEAPYFKTPTINIGDRQKGRVRCDSILDCLPDTQAIVSGIQKALSNDFQEKIKMMSLPYRKDSVASKIIDILKKVDLSNLIKKQFYDIKDA